jgi:elongation factor 3
MGKGQQLRREAAAAASAANAGSPGLPLSGSNMSGMRVNAPAFNMNAPAFVPRPQSNLESAAGMGVFMGSDGAGRMSAVNNLLASTESVGGMKKNNSMQSLVSRTPSPGLGAGMKKSSSLEDIAAAHGKNDDIAADLAAIVKSCGLYSPEATRILTSMADQINNGVDACASLALLFALMESLGRAVEPFVAPLLARVVALNGDKSAAVRDLASKVGCRYAEMTCRYSFRSLWVVLHEAVAAERDWRVRAVGCQMLQLIADRCPEQVSPLLPEIMPAVSLCATDAKKQLSVVATAALHAACKCITNEDILHLVPQLVNVIANPDDAPKTLDLLMETTFVSNVESSTLALIAPLLSKTLRGRSAVNKRKACKVIDSMCRLIQEPADVAPFIPLLLPVLERVIDEIADVEVAGVAKEAHATVLRAIGEFKEQPADSANTPSGVQVDACRASVRAALMQVLAPFLDEAVGAHVSDCVSEYSADLVAQLVVFGSVAHPELAGAAPADVWRHAVAMSNKADFMDCVVPFVRPLVKFGTENNSMAALGLLAVEDADVAEEERLDQYCAQVGRALRSACLGSVPDVEIVEEEDVANVCNIEFSLAFGGKILLHNAHLKLARGRRYGLMGKNGAGKTTLLTNIATHNIEGFPETLRTIYVQHDDSAMPETELSLLDELVAMPLLAEVGVTKEQAFDALKAINFTDTMLAGHRNDLSGGWKMKLAIVRAQLSQADVLLLDEPTNHLDSASVKWLGDYLNSLSEVTCLIVSHDTAFMDATVTDIIHYESRKLVYYRGSLADFVQKHPEAKYYYELSSSDMKFTFPTPERLDGVTSTTKMILKMDNVTFTYPGRDKPTIRNATVRVCLGSRVAVLGPNGAGKSTLIKMLVQETLPDGAADVPEGEVNPNGEVWKHHNLRVAYVAQHSFHHIEKHLDISPVEYIKWRFEGAVDKEDLNKEVMKMDDEEENKVAKVYGDVNKVVGRRKNGRVMEYECTWIGQGMQVQTTAMKKRGIAPQPEPNKYIPLEEMIALGHAKLVAACDARIAGIAAGLDLRPLVQREIQSHLDDFNLDAEFGTHGNIRRLSGGQKVKLVLAAAMWNRPHLIVLDEPTNYLDREALGALTDAIKRYNGGVIIISHHEDFTKALCTETWHVNNGTVTVEGQVEETKIHDNKVFKKQVESAEAEERAADKSGAKSGNTNKTKEALKQVKNPRTFEFLTKKEVRRFSKLADVAGVSLEEYVGKITKDSPEWKMLSTNINC